MKFGLRLNDKSSCVSLVRQELVWNKKLLEHSVIDKVNEFNDSSFSSLLELWVK